MTTAAFLGGLAMLTAVLGTAGYAGRVAIDRLAPQLAGPDRWIAWALAATTALLVEHAVPLTLGILTKGTVLATTAIVAVIAARTHTVVRGAEPRPVAPRTGVVVRWCAGIAALFVTGGALAYLKRHGAQPTLSVDTLTFQLPQVARWIQTHSLWQLDQFFPDYSNATYPQHGNLLLLAVVLPFRATFLARLVPVPYLALTALGVYAAARELGAARAWALLAGALPAAIPIFIREGLEGANTDTPMTFFVIAAVLFGLRHHRTTRRSDLVLAGLACGLALGTKWYALTTLGPMLAVWALATRRPRWIVTVGVLTLAGGGLWLLRNLVEAHNPVFPAHLGPFNAPRDVIHERYGSSLADYLFNGHVWRAILLPQFNHYLAAPGYALALGIPAGLLVAWRRRAGRAGVVALAGLAMVLVYFFMSYSAFGTRGNPDLAFASMRYVIPALLLGGVALAWAATQLDRALLAVVLLVVVAGGLKIGYRPDLTRTAIVAGAVVCAAAVWAVRRTGPRVAVIAAVAVGLLGVVVVRGQAQDRWYGGADPTLAWVQQHARPGTRVALAGTWPASIVAPVLPAFGPRLENRVAYAGVFRHSMLRAVHDPAAFARRLRGYDVLIVGRGVTPTNRPAPEEAWATRAGFRSVVASPSLALLVRG